jgi:hypothetical protein
LEQPVIEGWAELHRVSNWDSAVLSTRIGAWQPHESQKPVGADLATKRADGQQTQEVFTHSTSWSLLD